MKVSTVRYAIVDRTTKKFVSAAFCGYAMFKFVGPKSHVKLWARKQSAQKKLDEHKKYVATRLLFMPYGLNNLDVIPVEVTLEAKIPGEKQ